jgi:NAD(P)-dependent dehydrogenase (short-subunit alcohol dehydrogenase family)
MPKLANKVALITGAAGGQGTAEAELFVREGAAVMLTDVDAAKGEALAKRLGGEGGRVLFRVHDAASEAAWQEIVAATLVAFGGLHILVNNAGTIARQGIVATTLEAWNRTLAVNLTGPLLGMKHCAPAIRDSGGGSIVNISSTAGLTAHDDAAYTASKWGLRGLTKTAVLQFSPWNIRVNLIHITPLPISASWTRKVGKWRTFLATTLRAIQGYWQRMARQEPQKGCARSLPHECQGGQVPAPASLYWGRAHRPAQSARGHRGDPTTARIDGHRGISDHQGCSDHPAIPQRKTRLLA